MTEEQVMAKAKCYDAFAKFLGTGMNSAEESMGIAEVYATKREFVATFTERTDGLQKAIQDLRNAVSLLEAICKR